MAINYDEKEKELDQKMRRLKAEKRKLQRQKQADERKHRDHVMIVIGSTLLTHYSEEQKSALLTMTDEEVKAWVHARFERKPGGEG